MATDSSHSDQTRRALQALARERKEEADTRSTIWSFIWTMFAFKIVTIGLIWYAAAGSGESLSMIVATTWYWLAIPAAAIAGPLFIRWRLIRMRQGREHLRQSEWSSSTDAVSPLDAESIQIFIRQVGPGGEQPTSFRG